MILLTQNAGAFIRMTELDFETAAELRDKKIELKQKLQETGGEISGKRSEEDRNTRMEKIHSLYIHFVGSFVFTGSILHDLHWKSHEL